MKIFYKWVKNLFIVILLSLISLYHDLSAQITISVNTGKFENVYDAAKGENKVNWWDADLTDDQACTESFAAVELAAYLKLCPSLDINEIKFVSGDELPTNQDVFIIGSRQSNKLISSGILPESDDLKTDQSFHIFSFRDKERIITIIEGKDRIGSLYGVYAYLEKLGYRFYGLGEQGTVYPDTISKIPAKLDIIENPSYHLRGFKNLRDRGNEDFFYWMARNRMNYCDETGNDTPFRKKLGMNLVRGGHRIQGDFLSPKKEYPYNHTEFKGDENKLKDPYTSTGEYTGDINKDGILTYFEAHPEWYGLRNGKRSDKADISPGDNYCTSNMDANNELAYNLVQSLIDGEWKNVDIIDFWMLDNGRWCECENCQQQGIYSDRLMDVAYLVQKEIQKAQSEKRLNREIFLATLAYHETLPPPRRRLPDDFDYDHFFISFFVIERCYVHAIADPSCTEINKFLLDNYKGWTMDSDRNYKGSLLIGEYFNVSSFKSLPVVFPTIMATDIPWYYNTGARHMNYMHTPVHTWGTWTLNQYLYARLLWNVNTDADLLINEFFEKYYPTTSKTTGRFYKHVEIAFSNLKPFKHYAGEKRYTLRRNLTRDTSVIFPLDHLQYESHHPLLNDGPDITDMIDELSVARKELDASLLHCKDQTEQLRLIDDNRRFAYGEATVYFYYHLVRTALLHRSSNEPAARMEFLEVGKYADQLRKITDLLAPARGELLPDAAVEAKDGLEASQAESVYNYFKEKYGN